MRVKFSRVDYIMGPHEVVKGIYIVGGGEITDPRDAAVYLLDLGELVLIDTGGGESYKEILKNIEQVNLSAQKITTIILTHCHIDHIGGAKYLQDAIGCRIIMHELDANAVERGDTQMTAAHWYRLPLLPMDVNIKIKGDESLSIGDHVLGILHTPGHTPGSLSVYIDKEGERILFGQDIHGPFSEEFGSDLAAWRQSMKRLLGLEADVLCEGHLGVFRPKDKVTAYIEHYIKLYSQRGA